MKLNKIKLKDVKSFLIKLPELLGKNAFIVFLILFGLSVLFSLFIFYLHRSSIDNIEPETIGHQFQFNYNNYQKVIEIWQSKEENLNEAGSKNYPNPFES